MKPMRSFSSHKENKKRYNYEGRPHKMKCCMLFFVMFIFMFFSQNVFANIENIVDDRHFTILQRDVGSVVDTSQVSDDPLRRGTYTPVKEDNFIGVDRDSPGVRPSLGDKELSHDDNLLDTINIVKRILNYILGFIGLVALIYMIFHGVKYITGSEESVAEDAGKKIKSSFIAIGGIAVSYFIVTFIYYVISLLVQ